MGRSTRMEEGRSAFKILTGRPKSTGTKPSGWPRCRWKDNIIMDLEDIGINVEKRVDSTQNRD